MELSKIVTKRNTILQIDDAHICYKNFSGEGDRFTREGDRSFHLIFDDPVLVDELVEEGWNIKIKEPRDEAGNTDPDAVPFMVLKVKIKFNDYGPKCYLYSGKKRIELTEENIGMLDRIQISQIDMDVRSYDWEANGKTGRAAYLDGLRVYQRVNRFTADFDDDFGDEEDPI